MCAYIRVELRHPVFFEFCIGWPLGKGPFVWPVYVYAYVCVYIHIELTLPFSPPDSIIRRRGYIPADGAPVANYVGELSRCIT